MAIIVVVVTVGQWQRTTAAAVVAVAVVAVAVVAVVAVVQGQWKRSE